MPAPALAQGGEGNGASESATPEPPELAIGPGVLEIELRPLRRDELKEEAERWIGLLQAKVQELSDVEIAAREATGEAKAELGARADKLREERGMLVTRVDVVLDAFEAKGGDAEEYRAYLDAVNILQVDTSDPLVAMQSVKAWAVSPEGGLKWAGRIAAFIGVLIAAWIVSRVVARIVRQAIKRLHKTSELLQDFLVNLARKAVLIVGVVVAVGQLGIEVGPLVAAIGAVGFILGFALQGTLSNFASGIMILAYRPFDVGDAVEVAGVSGKVEAMTLVSTTIATFDNQTNVVPNNEIWGNVIKNITGRSTRRVDMKFGISYADDMNKAKSILEELVKAHPLVLADPEPVIKVHELADSSVNIICRPWSKTGDYWAVYWDLMQQVKERFDADGISIPFPQRDLHIFHETSANVVTEGKPGATANA
jgi:small conductance mechanosensitive channel